MPYYDNPQFLSFQIGHWLRFPPAVRSQLSAIIVDDGSPKPASEVLAWVRRPFPIRIFRIAVDVRWNWIAARNIGMTEAPWGWCLLTDMDHVLPTSTAAAVLEADLDPETIYGLTRVSHDGSLLTPHPNSWLVTRDLFWRIGGYDEALSGYYGTDGDWRRRCARAARLAILDGALVRYEGVLDASTTRYQRKQPEDAAVSRIIRRRGADWRPRVLSFPYDEVR